MKQRCVREVSRALGRPIDGVEAQAIEQNVLAALRANARDRATFKAQSAVERVLAAGQSAARETLGEALARRARVGAPRGRRFAQSQRTAPWIAQSVPGAEVESWRALAADPAATPEAILSHPAQAAIEAAAPETGGISLDDASDPAVLDGRTYRIDGQEFDADGYVAHMRAKFEADVPVPIRRERRAVIITGQPGAGKSTTRRALARLYGATSVDVDEMRPGIPEFADGRGSNHVTHVEAKLLRDRVLELLIGDSQNVLFEGVGHNGQSLLAIAAQLRAAGYRVELANVKVSFANSVRRYALRTLSEGRWIGADYVRKVGDSPQRVYQQLVEAGGFDGYIQVDADGPQGAERISHAAGIDADAAEAALRQGAAERSRYAGDDRADGRGDPSGRSAGGETEGLGQEPARASDDGRRGETFIPDDGVFADPGVIVSLFETADASTPFHEIGHVYLETFKAYAGRANAPAQLRNDWAEIARWLELDETGDIAEAAHEKFARGIERYAAEGRAPSPALESFFAAFKRWFTAIYRSLDDLDVELTPEIRAVFDRLLKDPDDALNPNLERSDRLRADGGDRPLGEPGAEPAGTGDDGAGGRRPAVEPAGAGPRADGAADGAGGGDRSRAGARAPATQPGTLITPTMLKRDPDLKAIADELVETRAEIDALERQGRIEAAEADAARADLERIEKAAARPELLRSAAFCLMHGARVNRIGGA